MSAQPATFRLVSQCLKQLRHHTHLTEAHASYKRGPKLVIENLEKIRSSSSEYLRYALYLH